jgi:predicted porin
MKTKLLAVLATLGMVASASAVKINNNISINGFIDGSYNTSDNGAGDETFIGLDEVELNILANAGNIAAELHLDTGDINGDLDIEQANFTYSFGNGASVTVGTFGSALGFEREDPAGLYTFSRAYSFDARGYDLGDIDNRNAQEGARLNYSAGDISASLALYDGVDAQLETRAGVKNDLNYELAIGYNGIENLSLLAGIQTDRAAGAGNDVEIYNLQASYTLNKLLIAAEYTNREEDGSADTSAYMVLADYDVNDKLGFAVRYSSWETSATEDTDKLTFAPNYAITDSLGAIVEFSAQETSVGGETDSFAVELTYTF